MTRGFNSEVRDIVVIAGTVEGGQETVVSKEVVLVSVCIVTNDEN